MKRQDKYPDTKWFHYHNANPKNRITTDCVARSLCMGLDLPYEKVVVELAEMQCATGYDKGDVQLYGRYLESKGWVKHKQPRKPDGKKYTGKEFCEQVNNNQKYVANIGGGHVVAIVGSKVWDTWDSSDGCIGNYWIKE